MVANAIRIDKPCKANPKINANPILFSLGMKREQNLKPGKYRRRNRATGSMNGEDDLSMIRRMLIAE